MNLTLHQEFSDSLAIEWNALLEKNTIRVPFLEFQYQSIWWKTRGGGEWPDARLLLITAYQKEQLVGIAPLFSTQQPDGSTILFNVGSIEVSDYLDLLVLPEHRDEFISGLLEYLSGLEIPNMVALNFYNMLDSSPTLLALQSDAATAGWQVSIERLQHSPYIPLPGDWEAYLAGIDKKQRHEVRRKMRRATELNPPARWYLTSDPQRLEEDISAFLELMRHEEDKAAFLTEAMQTHMRLTIRCAFENGCLNLAFLEVDGQKACGYLSFDYLNRIWVYNSGMDPRYKDYSPGWVLLGHLLQWANENGREMLDFMRGNEEYKYRFGATDRFVMRATLHP